MALAIRAEDGRLKSEGLEKGLEKGLEEFGILRGCG
jgi:hypothetical protein